MMLNCYRWAALVFPQSKILKHPLKASMMIFHGCKFAAPTELHPHTLLLHFFFLKSCVKKSEQQERGKQQRKIQKLTRFSNVSSALFAVRPGQTQTVGGGALTEHSCTVNVFIFLVLL